MKITPIIQNYYLVNNNLRNNSFSNITINNKIYSKANVFEKANIVNDNIYYAPVNINFCSIKNKTIVQEIFNQLEKNNCPIEQLSLIKNKNNGIIDEFINEYCKRTGFPNLTIINNKMKSHATNMINKSANDASIPVIWSGFHKQCSASFDLALPGSDLDATAMIVDGTQEQIDRFKNNLWNSYNPIIVSIRKDFEFPDVFSIQQLYEWTNLLDKAMIKEGYSQKTNKYLSNFNETSDYERALEFNIDAAEAISKYTIDDLIKNVQSLKTLLRHGNTPKNITQSMSSCLESMRSGISLISEKENSLSYENKAKLERIKNSYLYKFGNICIQEAKYKPKEKYSLRKKQINEEWFNKLDRESKLNFILKMIYESYPYSSKSKLLKCNSNIDFTEYAKEFFENEEGVNESRTRAFNKTVD